MAENFEHDPIIETNDKLGKQVDLLGKWIDDKKIDRELGEAIMKIATPDSATTLLYELNQIDEPLAGLADIIQSQNKTPEAMSIINQLMQERNRNKINELITQLVQLGR